MLHPLRTILLLCALAFAPIAQAQHHSSGSHSHSSSHSSKSKAHSSKSKKSAKGDKSVHVNGYYRKDGTYVHGYDRAAPGSASTATSSTLLGGSVKTQPYRKDYIAQNHRPDSSVRIDRHGKIKRSKAEKDAFRRGNPCPSTGKNNGACPGYVVDHINALECGGADAAGNMQWQTAEAAKEKDRTERLCRQ